MPELFEGYTLQQKTVTVSKGDVNVNAEIDTQAADGWSVAQIVPDGEEVIILFSRTLQTVAL